MVPHGQNRLVFDARFQVFTEWKAGVFLRKVTHVVSVENPRLVILELGVDALLQDKQLLWVLVKV
jgi:acetoin utilization deacetylase AcuC-like enzyme